MAPPKYAPGRFQNSMSWAVIQRFDCAYKTLYTAYSLLLSF